MVPVIRGGFAETRFFCTTDERIKSTDRRGAFAMHACCRKALLHMALVDVDGSATKSERLAVGGLVRTQSAGARLTGVLEERVMAGGQG